ncbi:MAG: hypothetical protein EU531_04340 [Promethearchaeota archaeon]|nr:MAG: hypothetical protein EU531_04340 [Candidatus Lokiarchaeota archaeon]
MDEIKNELITKAEEFEKLSKIEVKRQNYEEAVSLLFQAKEIYEEAGLTGQVSILIKKIANLKKLIPVSPARADISSEEKIKLEVNPKENLEEKGIELLGKAYELALNGELDIAIDLYNEAYNLYKKLNHDYECKQILWQINEIKEHQRWKQAGKIDVTSIPLKDIVSLSQAEKRRRKIQETLSPLKEKTNIPHKKEIPEAAISEKSELKKPKLFRQIQEQEKQEQLQKSKEEQIRREVQDIRLQKIREKQEKLRALQQQKNTEQELINQANNYLDQANKNLKKKTYDEAKELYLQSIKIFANLGWNNQVRTLKQELRNIEIYKKEDARKDFLEQQKKIQSEQKFEKRVSAVLNEKERFLEKAKADKALLPPEIKLKLEKAEFTKEKAEKEEKIPNLERALARYQYVLELYKSIPTEFHDTSEEIITIQKKISELKEKM